MINSNDREQSRALNAVPSGVGGIATSGPRRNREASRPNFLNMSSALAADSKSIRTHAKASQNPPPSFKRSSWANSAPQQGNRRSRSPPDLRPFKRQRTVHVAQRDHVSESSDESVVEEQSRPVEAVRAKALSHYTRFDDKSGPGPSSTVAREKMKLQERPAQDGLAETHDSEDDDPINLLTPALDRNTAPVILLTSRNPLKGKDKKIPEPEDGLQRSQFKVGNKQSKPPPTSSNSRSIRVSGNQNQGPSPTNVVPDVSDYSVRGVGEHAVDSDSTEDTPIAAADPDLATDPLLPRLNFDVSLRAGSSGRPPAFKSGTQVGVVKQAVVQFESRYPPPSNPPTRIPIPGSKFIPASKVPATSVKTKMKPRQAASTALLVEVDRSQGPSDHARRKGTQRQQTTLPLKVLPLKAWYLGSVARLPINEDLGCGFCLKWTDKTISICQREHVDDNALEYGRSFSATVKTDIRDVQVSPRDPDDPVIVALKVTMDRLRHLHSEAQEDDMLILLFQTTAPDWRLSEWHKLHQTLEFGARSRSTGLRPEHGSSGFSILQTPAPARLLEIAKRTAANACASLSPKPTPAQDDADEIEEEEPIPRIKTSADPIGYQSRRKARSGIDDHDSMIPFSTSGANTVRKSKRQVAQTIEQLGLSINDTEFLFSYPPLNITRGELNRLEPDEFLNDTLIEFGLKMWTNDLTKSDPALADSIWVFNSFFYKKLSGKKNPEEAYHSVQKWTAKVDIFQKRFIVIPINENLHWYLAVIYRPDYCLIPRETVMRTSARKSAAKQSQHDIPVSPTTTDVAEQKEVEADLDVPDTDLDRIRPPTDASDSTSHPESTSHSTPNFGPFDDQHGDIQMSDIADDGDDDIMEIDPQAVDSDIDQLMADTQLGERANSDGPEVEVPTITLTPEREDDWDMPAPASPLASRLATTPPLTVNIEVQSDPVVTPADAQSEDTSEGLDANRSDVVPLPSKSPTTLIFMLDSLGGQHPKAANTLKSWLRLEAKTKKDIDISDPVSKKVPVPFQPNHVDCGVYLLHFADVIVRKADEIQRLIESRGLKDAAARSQVFEGDMLKKKRATLKQRTVELMEAWSAEHPPDPLAKAGSSTVKLPDSSTSNADDQSALEAKKLERDNAPRRPPVVRPSNGTKSLAVSGDPSNPVVVGQDDHPDAPLAPERSENINVEPSTPVASTQAPPVDDSDDDIEFIKETRKPDTPKSKKNPARKGKDPPLRLR